MIREEAASALHGLHCSDLDLITTAGRVFSPTQKSSCLQQTMRASAPPAQLVRFFTNRRTKEIN